MRTEEPNPFRSNLLVASVGETLAVTANSLWIMLIPLYLTRLGMIDVVIGVVFSLGALVKGILSLAGGRLSDRFGRCSTIWIGYAVYATGPLVILYSTYLTGIISQVVAVLGFVWLFVGSGIAGPGMSMLLIESSPEKRKGLYYMMVTRVLPSIPPAAGLIVGGVLYADGLYDLALIAGFIGVMVTAVLYRVRLKETLCTGGEVDSSISKPELKPRRRYWDRFLLLVILAFALDGLSSRGLSWYVPIFLGTSDEIAVFYSTMTSVATIVIALSALVSGWVVDKAGVDWAIVLGWVPLSVTVFLFPFSTSAPLTILLYSIWSGLDMMDVSIPAIVIADEYPPEKRGAVMGTFSSSTQVASIVGPATISAVLLLGRAFPFYVKSTMNLLAVAFFVLARRYRSGGLLNHREERPLGD